MRSTIAGAVMALLAGTAVAGVTGTPVVYSADSVTLKGYIARDGSVKGKRPGMLVVHEWWGHNAYARKRADMLAGLGYVALAVDMYGDGKQATHPEDAGKFSSAVSSNMPLMKARFQAALNLLKKDPDVDPDRIGAIGYCFGGGVVLTMAREGADLKAVVSFHGSLAFQSPPEKGAVTAKILVCNGAADKFITPDAIAKFKQEMNAAGASYTFINYAGAKHSFTNPEATAYGKEFMLPMAYNEQADRKSWEDMKQFFKKAMGSPIPGR